MSYLFLDKILLRNNVPKGLAESRNALINKYSILCILTASVFLIHFLIFKYYWLSVSLLPFLILLALPVIFSKKGLDLLAKNLILGSGVAGIIVFVLLVGKGNGYQLFFFPLTFATLTIFPKENKIFLFLYLFISVFSFLSIELLIPDSYNPFYLTASFQDLQHFISAFLSLILTTATGIDLYANIYRVEGSLQVSQIQNKAILNGIPDQILHFNLDGTCLGYKDNQNNEGDHKRFVGQPIRRFLNAALTEKLLTMAREVIETRQVIHFEWESSIYGNKKFLEYRLCRFDDTEVITIIRDISDKMEQETNKKAKEVAESSVKAKSDFLSSMSHEIRTPMNIILGLSKLLLRDTSFQGQAKENLEAISFSAENLLVIVNDILDLSKIEAGKLSIEEKHFNLKNLINKHINFMRLSALEKNLQLDFNIDERIPEFFYADPVRINQVMMNLTGNAIKYTRKGKVEVFLELVERKGSLVSIRFRIKDTGIGIPPEKVNFIFESFNQIQNTEETKGGTGLGLTISQKLVNLMGGNIDVKSVIGLGSTFSFILPLREAPQLNALEHQEFKQSLPDLEGLHILLAEDNSMNQFYAKQLLSSWKVAVDVAGNGLEVLELACSRKYDLILMDIQMPLMNGYEAMDKLHKAQGPNKDTPVICVSADVFPESRKKAMEKGMKDFLTKPIDENDLFRIIQKYVRKNKPEVCEPLKMEVLKTQNLLNLEGISYIIRNDPEALSEFLDLFISSTKEDLDKLSSATILMDLDKIRGYAHKLKSSFRNIGATPSVEIFQKIENISEGTPSQQQIAGLVREVIQHYQKIKEEVIHRTAKIV